MIGLSKANVLRVQFDTEEETEIVRGILEAGLEQTREVTLWDDVILVKMSCLKSIIKKADNHEACCRVYVHGGDELDELEDKDAQVMKECLLEALKDIDDEQMLEIYCMDKMNPSIIKFGEIY